MWIIFLINSARIILTAVAIKNMFVTALCENFSPKHFKAANNDNEMLCILQFCVKIWQLQLIYQLMAVKHFCFFQRNLIGGYLVGSAEPALYTYIWWVASKYYAQFYWISFLSEDVAQINDFFIWELWHNLTKFPSGHMAHFIKYVLFGKCGTI